MSRLTIYCDTQPSTPELSTSDITQITERLAVVGVRFERWQTSASLQPGAEPNTVLQAYEKDIKRLVNEEGYQAVDVVSLNSDHPDKTALRDKFLSEHTHNEDEVRFFVGGGGLFSLHLNDKVYEVLCQQGDLISVPANSKHWFDMGPNPNFIAIRFFNNPEGWVAQYTENPIAERFSRLEN